MVDENFIKEMQSTATNIMEHFNIFKDSIENHSSLDNDDPSLSFFRYSTTLKGDIYNEISELETDIELLIPRVIKLNQKLANKEKELAKMIWEAYNQEV